MKRFLIITVLIALSLLAINGYKDNVISVKRQLDSLYQEADTIAYMQKAIIISYPRLTIWEAKAYAPILREFQKTYNIPFPLMLAVLGTENLCDPTQTSSAGCKGLGQLSDAAKHEGCRKLGIDTKRAIEWIEPVNLALSLSYLCTRYADHDREFAIKSYVGGNGYKKANSKNAAYIKSYSQCVEKEEDKIKNMLTEADKVTYIYKGIIYERIIESSEMSKKQRSLLHRVRNNNPTKPIKP